MMSSALITPSQWRAHAYPARHERRARSLDAVWLSAHGAMTRIVRRGGRYLRGAQAVIALQEEHAALGEHDLDEALRLSGERRRRGRSASADTTRALSLLREAARREIGIEAYPEQLAAALALLDGCAVELATGEGKTLAAALAACVQGWGGRGCHVVTVNDYLTSRDAEWMGPLYRRAGLRVGCVGQSDDAPSRRAAYASDVTYTTSREAAADSLRDRIALGGETRLAATLARSLAGREQRAKTIPVMRGLAFAIVDEADSVLIDDATTPLIISSASPNDALDRSSREAERIATSLIEEQDYRIRHRDREVELTEPGRKRLDEACDKLHGPWRGARRREEFVTLALTARSLYDRDRDYIVRDGKIVIIDERTGRMLPDRTWRAGLHQAIEAKERVAIRPMQETAARISFQRFFRRYPHLSGMSGTVREVRGELWKTYRMPTVVLPPHRPSRRVSRPPVIVPDEERKWRHVIDEVRQANEQGRPVLIGTTSIEQSERLGRDLKAAGIAARILNAVRHAEEAEIIREAGLAGRVTVATNMAGRGADIPLGEGVAQAGGLHVVATAFHESARIDRQLFGRCGRQGDPGSCRTIASLTDDLLDRDAPWLGALARHVPGRLAILVCRLAQRRAQHDARRRRRAAADSDDTLIERLGFAGPD